MPDHQGFGTRMLQRIVGGDMRGSVEIDFDPAGLSCAIEAPAEVLAG